MDTPKRQKVGWRYAYTTYNACYEFMTWENPIAKEVRQVRDQIAAEHNYDIKALYRYLQEREKYEHRTIVTRPPRRADVEKQPLLLLGGCCDC